MENVDLKWGKNIVLNLHAERTIASQPAFNGCRKYTSQRGANFKENKCNSCFVLIIIYYYILTSRPRYTCKLQQL